MRLLLDTHFLLWYAANTLSPKAEEVIFDETNTLYFSPASIWEIAIKNALNKPDFKADPHLIYNGLIQYGFEELQITSVHTLATTSLPNIHKDPFDRILLAQVVTENMHLLTADDIIAKYPAPVIYLK
jgi:PIN domain nuclease of toxin-antitoxin system